jgi:hypothetical protein
VSVFCFTPYIQPLTHLWLYKVEKFKYLRTTLTNQNDIYDEIKSRLNSENIYLLSVQNILSFRLICKTLNTKINTTVILSVVLYG